MFAWVVTNMYSRSTGLWDSGPSWFGDYRPADPVSSPLSGFRRQDTPQQSASSSASAFGNAGGDVYSSTRNNTMVPAMGVFQPTTGGVSWPSPTSTAPLATNNYSSFGSGKIIGPHQLNSVVVTRPRTRKIVSIISMILSP